MWHNYDIRLTHKESTIVELGLYSTEVLK